MPANRTSTSRPAGLGTFAGVFTPSILTILGLVLFLRTGYLVGGAGLGKALLIIILANVISILTSISLSAIATNLRVRGGGDYYLISRTLGVEFGGALGLVLFLAQTVSVAFYIIGFAEIVSVMLGAEHAMARRLIAWAALVLLLVPAWIGSDWATRFQYVIMGVLFAAIAAFFAGGVLRWDPVLLAGNFSRTDGLPFWVLFAVFFPAVTGFTQGVSMSGDLADPGRSLPLGTFLAVGVSIVVYVAAAVTFAASIPAAELVDDPQAMRTVAFVTWLVDAGVIAACLSSGLASFLGAPRILQALAADRIFEWLAPFAAGHGETNNPRRGVLLTGLIAATVVALGSLNAIAGIVAMFFLISYGLLNYATFAEARGNSPHFRPRFRFFNAWLSLAGALACLGAMLAISPLAGALALAVLFLLHQYLARRTRDMPDTFADSSRSYRLQRVRRELLAISAEPEHARDWRPVILAFSDDTERRMRLLRFAGWVEGGSGFTTLVRLVEGEGAAGRRNRDEAEKQMREGIVEAELPVHVRVVAAPDTRAALPVVMQAHGMGRIEANTVMLNWFGRSSGGITPEALAEYGENLHIAVSQRCNMVILAAEDGDFRKLDAADPESLTLDVWYRDSNTGRLMMMLAYLMTRSDPWKDARLRVLTSAESGRDREVRVHEIEAMLDDIRIEADPVVVDTMDVATVQAESAAAGCVFLPFRLTRDGPSGPFGGDLAELLDGLGLTALVLAASDIDLDADPETNA